MKSIDKNKDKLWNAWADLYKLYINCYLPESLEDWQRMYDESNRLCHKYKDDELVCLITAAILTYAEKRKRGEISAEDE